MLNGLKGLFTPDNEKSGKEQKSGKRAVVIIASVVIIVLAHLGYTFIGGTEEERNAVIETIKNNFHINYIDLVLCSSAFMVYMILKIKNKKE